MQNEITYHPKLVTIPMAESFVVVCDMLLKFHNLPVKFVCNFNE